MNEPIKITYEDAVLGLKRQVALKGEDYVYEKIPLFGRPVGEHYQGSCVNWINGQPSCIVGHYVAELLGGVPHDGIGTGPVRALLPGLGIEATDKAMGLLRGAQWRQDAGAPWGVAVENAISDAAEIEGP